MYFPKEILKVNDGVYIEVSPELKYIVESVWKGKGYNDICLYINGISKRKYSPEDIRSIYDITYEKIHRIRNQNEQIKSYKSRSKYLRKICSADILYKVSSLFQFCFRWYFFVPMIIFLFLIYVTKTTYIGKTNISDYRNITMTDYLIFVFLATISLFIHEIGHATSMLSMNIKHGNLYVDLRNRILISFFVDTPNIFELSIFKRIVVYLSGIYFQFLFMGILVITNFLFNILNLVVVSMVINTTIIGCLLQLIPFFQTDGYKILSDVIKNHNLYTYSKMSFIQSIKDKKYNFLSYYYLMVNVIGVLISIFFLFYFYANVYDGLSGSYQCTNIYLYTNVLFFVVLFCYTIFSYYKHFAKETMYIYYKVRKND